MKRPLGIVLSLALSLLLTLAGCGGRRRPLPCPRLQRAPCPWPP